MLTALIGNRTYILSILALVLALILQADTQGILVLVPMLKMTFAMVLTIIVPLIPVFMRVAVEKMRKSSY